MRLFESLKSFLSIINGILILVIFFRRPIVRWWIRNIASKWKKLEVELEEASRKFNCIQKELTSEIEFDCPPITMDDGSKQLFVRQYRFKINALIYGTDFCDIFSNMKNIELTVIHREVKIKMFPVLIDREGKDTRIFLESFKPLKNPPRGSTVIVKFPYSDNAEDFITSTLMNLPRHKWDEIYRKNILEAERREKKL